jgi:hypothetical protein
MSWSAVVRRSIAPATGLVCYFFAPQVNSKNPSTDLSAFFSTSATLLATFFIALALLSIVSPLANLRIQKIMGEVTFVYLGLGIIAAVSATVVTWHNWVYPYFFAITTGAGIGAMLAITRVGIANLQTQKAEIHASLAQLLGRSPSEDSHSGPADELTKFARLRDQGHITAEEFEREKKKLLT